jgi:hypothetical protein
MIATIKLLHDTATLWARFAVFSLVLLIGLQLSLSAQTIFDGSRLF